MMVDEQLTQFLRKRFGFETFKSAQLAIIKSLLNHHDTLAVLPTGTGKSLCYQFFGAYTNQRVIIVAPLVSLMIDQVQQLQRLGLKNAIALTSATLGAARAQILANLAQYQFILLAPEMLANQAVLTAISRLKIGLFVVDEAHCISTWGYDFRLQYTQLTQVLARLRHPLTLALTATASKRVQQDIIKQLQLKQQKQFVVSANRQNIFMQRISVASQAEKDRKLAQIITALRGSGIIYFSSKKLAEKLAAKLSEITNKKIAVYHADVNSDERLVIQKQFILGQVDVLCATSAFGMGINKPDVRYVIHYHMPADIANYLQEIGRAGRDGKFALALALVSPGDEQLQAQLQLSNLPASAAVRAFLQQWQRKKTAQTPPHEFELVSQLAQKNYSLSQIDDYLSKRKQVKQHQLSQMHTWLTTTACLRQCALQLLGDDSVVNHHQWCCSTQTTVAAAVIKKVNALSLNQTHNQLQSTAEIWAKLFLRRLD